MPPLRGPVDSPATLGGLGSYRVKAPSRLIAAELQEESMAVKLDHRGKVSGPAWAGNENAAAVRGIGVGTQRLDFAEFYRKSTDDCLRTVLVSVGDQDTAQELVDEAFARAWASWRTVSRHPAPKAWVVRTALNANISRWRRRRREVSVPDPGLVADLAAAAGGSTEVPSIPGSWRP